MKTQLTLQKLCGERFSTGRGTVFHRWVRGTVFLRWKRGRLVFLSEQETPPLISEGGEIAFHLFTKPNGFHRRNTVPRTAWIAALAATLAFAPVAAIRAQDTPPPAPATQPGDTALGESAPAVQGLRDVSPKTLVFVFDVSGSMRGELLRRAREATITILREGCKSGDRVVLYTFGAGYNTVFDTTLKSEAEKRDLIAKVPTAPGGGAGTNIRKPHHDALKLLEANLPTPGAVVLLTDSFNDEPKKDDPAYPMYTRYYTPGGRLKKYPDTGENRDYERLLRETTDSQKVQIYGIGVQIDKSGRPVEQLPVAEATPATATETQTQTSTPVTVIGGGKGNTVFGLSLEWLIGLGALALAAFAALLLFLRGSKPVPLRIKGAPTGAKDYEIASGQTINLGGANAHSFDVYALPGIAAPVATLRGTGGRFTVAPAPETMGAAKVSLNGLPLDKESSLNWGDEVRISAPDATGALKEYRLIFDDPTKSF